MGKEPALKGKIATLWLILVLLLPISCGAEGKLIHNRATLAALDSVEHIEPLLEAPIRIECNKEGFPPIDIAITYNKDYQENVYSYVNDINTIEGGTHVTGFRRALTRTLKAYADQSGMLSKAAVHRLR